MKFGSLFSGCALGDLGLVQAGHEPAWFVEIDPFCQRILRLRFPGVPIYSDVKELDPSELEAVPFIAGYPPCQPISCAGKRKGNQDERWLWPELFRLLRGIRPKYVLLENPTGLFPGGFEYVLGEVAALGYSAVWQVLSAAQFGAPHQRNRVFILAVATGSQRNAGAEIDGVLRAMSSNQPKPDNPGGPGGSLWPTPCSRDWRDGSIDLHDLVATQGQGTLLNADWVEILLGLPPKWTDPNCPNDELEPFPGWPMERGFEQYNWEPPRTIPTKTDPYRRQRLMALGNGVVPHQMRAMGDILRELEELENGSYEVSTRSKTSPSARDGISRTTREDGEMF